MQQKQSGKGEGGEEIRLQKPQLVSDCPTKCAVNRVGGRVACDKGEKGARDALCVLGK